MVPCSLHVSRGKAIRSKCRRRRRTLVVETHDLIIAAIIIRQAPESHKSPAASQWHRVRQIHFEAVCGSVVEAAAAGQAPFARQNSARQNTHARKSLLARSLAFAAVVIAPLALSFPSNPNCVRGARATRALSSSSSPVVVGAVRQKTNESKRSNKQHISRRVIVLPHPTRGPPHVS